MNGINSSPIKRMKLYAPPLRSAPPGMIADSMASISGKGGVKSRKRSGRGSSAGYPIPTITTGGMSPPNCMDRTLSTITRLGSGVEIVDHW
jgi:hypothetical protein